MSEFPEEDEMRRLENAVIRAAVQKYYVRDSAVIEPDDLDANLEKHVDALVETMSAVGFRKRNGGSVR